MREINIRVMSREVVSFVSLTFAPYYNNANCTIFMNYISYLWVRWWRQFGGLLMFYISESYPCAMLMFIYSLLKKLVTAGESNHLLHTSPKVHAQNKQNKTWGPISILSCLYRPLVDVSLHHLDVAIWRVVAAHC